MLPYNCPYDFFAAMLQAEIDGDDVLPGKMNNPVYLTVPYFVKDRGTKVFMGWRAGEDGK
ncbi:MAG: hypothetical protein ACL93V_06340 [Candidatus Electrothrix sp. YB6]